MGLNIAQIHFMSGLSPNLSGNASAARENRPENQEFFFILRFTLKWYFTAALLMLGALVPLGLWFYESANLLTYNVGLTWVGLCFFSSFNFFVIWLTTIHEGLGNVEKASRVRLLQLLFSNSFIWLCLLADWGLVSFATGNTFGVLMAFVLLIVGHRSILISLLRFCIKNFQVPWKSAFWSFQWRIGVSWISGFFIINFFNPLILAFHGPIHAGQFGLSAHIMRSIATIANSITEVQLPKYGQMIKNKRFDLLDRLFLRTASLSGSLYLIGAGIFLCLWTLIPSYFPVTEDRLLPIGSLGLLSVIVGISFVSISISVFIRAHKVEPFLWISILNAAVTAIMAVALVPKFATAGAIASYFCGSVIVGLTGAIIIFRKFRRTRGYKSLLSFDVN